MLIRSLLFFGSLYFLQGAVLALIINFQKPYLAAHGVSREQIALLTSSMLFPFIGKIFLGALSDRVPIGRYGKRKPYVAIGLTLTFLSYGALGFVEPLTDFPMYFFLSVLATLGLALFDTTADGMAIDKTRETDQGLVQAAMLSGKSLGLILFSALFGQLVEAHGIRVAFWTLSFLTIPILFGCWLYSAPDRTDDDAVIAEMEPQAKIVFSSFFWLFAIYGVAYSITSFGIDGIMTLFMSDDLHQPPHAIGLYGSFRGIGALAGAVLGGFLLARLSKAHVAFVSLAFLMMAAFANSLMTEATPYWLWALFWGAAWALQETTFVTLAMALSVGRWSATIFALLMMFSNIGTSAGEAMATTLSAKFPMVMVIRGLACWLIPVMGLLALYLRKAPVDISEQ
jgi:PAT family beta-lactamase induction signal transducer AmpG